MTKLIVPKKIDKDQYYVPQGCPTPEIPFEQFYQKFETVAEIVKTKEWKECYSNFYNFNSYELGIKCYESMENLSPDRQEEEYLKCVNSFQYFCHRYVKIIHPSFGLIPFILYKYQQRVVRDYMANRFAILRKFRQAGLTTISVLKGWWECQFQTDRQILVMSKTDREAKAAGEVINIAVKELPSWLAPKMSKSNEHERHFVETGSRMWFYTPEAARSKSISWVIIDEAAHIEGMYDHWKAMYPVISTGGSCAVISTVAGMGNWYEETYHKAEARKNDFHIINLNYWEHPLYSNPKWEKENRANLGEKAWAQEILGSFLGSGDTFISADMVKELTIKTKDKGPIRISNKEYKNNSEIATEYGWEDGALWVWELPKEGHSYIIGTDCADGLGEGADNSAIQVVDENTLEQVAEYYSNNTKPHIFSQILYNIGTLYNNALIVVENTGIGASIVNALQIDLAYENIYYDVKNKRAKAGVVLSKNNRPQFLEALQNRILTRTLGINSIRLVNELNTFVYNHKTKKPEAQRGKHDDAIMAMCLALYIRDSQARDLPIGFKQVETTLKTYNKDTLEEIKNEILSDMKLEDFSLGEEAITYSNNNNNDEFPAVMFRRKHEKILKEFGW